MTNVVDEVWGERDIDEESWAVVKKRAKPVQAFLGQLLAAIAVRLVVEGFDFHEGIVGIGEDVALLRKSIVAIARGELRSWR